MTRFTRMAIMSAALAGLGSGSALAQVSLPYTFSANTPAKAAEVNANFQALLSGLNALGTPPVAIDSSYAGRQYSTSNTLTGRNVVVLRGVDTFNNLLRYSVYASYQNGTVNVNGTPTTFPFVRLLGYIDADATDTSVVGGRVVLSGANATDSRTWNVELLSYAGPTLASPSTVTNTRIDDFWCLTPRINGQLRHCRYKRTDPGQPTWARDDSRVETVFTGAFSIGSLNFVDGVEGGYLSELGPRDWYLIAKNIGFVGETRRFPVNNYPNLSVSLFVKYYRIEGVGTGGTTAGTIFANAANQVFFAP